MMKTPKTGVYQDVFDKDMVVFSRQRKSKNTSPLGEPFLDVGAPVGTFQHDHRNFRAKRNQYPPLPMSKLSLYSAGTFDAR